MATEHTGHTPSLTALHSVAPATQRVVVRAPLSIEGARTHTEPRSQSDELPEVDTELTAYTGVALAELDIDPDEFDGMLRHDRARRAVKRILDAEERPLTPIPPALSLTERFAMVRPAVEYRVEDWFVEGGHVLLVAQYKTGKTTLVGNLVRSVVDGEPFLGVAKVRPVANVVILDFEMSEGQIEGWLQDQDIRNTDRVHLVSLRGAASSFDILNPVRRREWAARLREVGAHIAVVDCLRPAMDALGLDEHSEAGRWFTAFDEMLKEAGIPEALVVHHSGHGGDRARGDSRILDWPDGIWSLVRENRDDLNSARFISAKGRDIDVDEGKLSFDPDTRHLTYTAKNRKRAGADRVMFDVLTEVARATDPVSIRDVVAAMRDGSHSRGSIEASLKKASDRARGHLSLVKGPKGSHLHSITAAGRAFLLTVPDEQARKEVA